MKLQGMMPMPPPSHSSFPAVVDALTTSLSSTSLGGGGGDRSGSGSSSSASAVLEAHLVGNSFYRFCDQDYHEMVTGTGTITTVPAAVVMQACCRVVHQFFPSVWSSTSDRHLILDHLEELYMWTRHSTPAHAHAQTQSYFPTTQTNSYFPTHSQSHSHTHSHSQTHTYAQRHTQAHAQTQTQTHTQPWLFLVHFGMPPELWFEEFQKQQQQQQQQPSAWRLSRWEDSLRVSSTVARFLCDLLARLQDVGQGGGGVGQSGGGVGAQVTMGCARNGFETFPFTINLRSPTSTADVFQWSWPSDVGVWGSHRPVRSYPNPALEITLYGNK